MSAIKKSFTESSFVETKATFVLDLVGVLATVAGLIALAIFGVTGDARFDGFGAMVVGTLMAVFSFMLVLNIKGFVIGKSVSRRTKEKIREAALEIDGVDGVLDLRAIASGNNQMLVNIEIHARDNMVTDELELLIDKVKSNVIEKVPEVSHIQVELETPNTI